MPIEPNHLSKAEEVKWKLLFSAVDADGDGKISAREVTRVTDAMGYPISERETRQFLAKCSVDSSARLNFDAFCKGLVESGVKFRVATFLCGLFKEMDADGDGQVTRDEVRQLVVKAGASDRIPQSKIDAFIAAADKDGDGQVSFEEFVNFLKTKLNM